tara:strand:+ start:586 stop:930 length:345 start_codon:yes stop_codon:yes gene_type:complete
MGNSICCSKRKNTDLSSKELNNLIKKKIKTKSNTDLVLKINEIKSQRTGDIIFCILMGTSAVITIVVIAHGAAEPHLASSLVVSVGMSFYYFNEIQEKNKLLDLYEKELKKRNI